MNGALMKASSRFAIAAALGLVVSAGSASAADLGGKKPGTPYWGREVERTPSSSALR